MVENHALMTARTKAGLSQGALARRIRETGHRLGYPNECTRGNVSRWETHGTQPQAHYLVILEAVLGQPVKALGFHDVDTDELPAEGTLLGSVSFPASALAGSWVTSYQFEHNGALMYHADIAHVTAESGDGIRAVNNPARTEGRTVPFHNEIEARLVSRHLTGHWKNTSDFRYFGLIHLAVLPGETVMEGYYTGFASDIQVSFGRWKWARLESSALADVLLREPRDLYDLVMDRQQNDAPLTLADVEDK
jgi:transcriptional regulator with XRE-family HTH domain